jgi:Domain of unknown function (DUF4124)
MKLRSFALAWAVAVPCAAMSADVVRWTDDGGRVHYGVLFDVPQRYLNRVEPADAPLPPGTTACQARWHRYAASAACFDQYRVVRGGLKPEAFQRCTEVPQPEPCQ